MALENEVAALVTSTTALQNEVGSQLAKVRAENTTFQATVMSKTGGDMTGALTLPSVTTTGNSIISGVNVGRGGNNHDTNTVAGKGSGQSLVAGGGVGLTAMGSNALKNDTTGSSNTAVGRDALSANTTASGVTAIGSGALLLNVSGQQNTALGFNALSSNVIGSGNTAVGFRAGLSLVGISNTSIGYNSLLNTTTGDGNTAVGQEALTGNTTGFNNTALGYLALSVSTNYANTSAIGCNAQVSGSNQVQLGDGTTTTYVYGTVQNRSDARDKTDIQPTVLGLDFIKALKPKDFRWDMRDAYRTSPPAPLSIEASDEEKVAYETTFRDWQKQNEFTNLVHDGSKKKKRIHHGLIAQEVEALIKATGQDFGGFQDHKRSGGQDVLSIGYDELIAPLIKAVQELAQANEDLRTRIAILEAGK